MDGFHGTAENNCNSIIEKGLLPSIGDSEWLGDGGYFFIKGISKFPQTQAKEWAIVESWDNITKRRKYNSFSVLKGEIEVDDDDFLDLTESDGVELLNYIQEKCRAKISQLGKKEIDYCDGYLINFARKELAIEIKVAKGNFFIKLKKEDRISNIRRRSPNCTICAVYSPVDNVNNLKCVEKGRIE